jgi:hypothetical protein
MLYSGSLGRLQKMGSWEILVENGRFSGQFFEKLAVPLQEYSTLQVLGKQIKFTVLEFCYA